MTRGKKNQLSEREIIEKSGNNFHCRVMDFFKKRGWYTLISPYYTDNITGKPREIDLVVEKEFRVNGHWARNIGTINIKLFIECKYIPKNIVFWFHDKEKHQAYDLAIRSSQIEKGNIFIDELHYMSSCKQVAKLFSSGPNNSSEQDIIYNALNQSLNALIYNRYSNSIIPPESGFQKGIYRTIEYPIIICNSFDNFFRVDMGGSPRPSRIASTFQLELNYAFLDSKKTNQNEYFLIDFVNYNNLDTFLKVIDSDVDIIIKTIPN